MRFIANTIILLVIIINFFCSYGSAAGSSRAGERFFTVYGRDDQDMAAQCVEAADGSIFSGGITRNGSYGNDDFLVSRHDSAGNMIWSRIFGSPGYERIRSLTATGDGGCAGTGNSDFFNTGNHDMILFKFDTAGNVQWFHRMGGAAGEAVECIRETPDSGLILAGYTASYGFGGTDGLIMKCDSTGSPLWYRVYGGADNEGARSVICTADSGYAVTGYTESLGPLPGCESLFVMKLDTAGNVTWCTVITGSGQLVGEEIVQTSDGGYAVAGLTTALGPGMLDLIICKLNSSGNLIWIYTYGTTDSDYCGSMIETQDHGLLISHSTSSYTGDPSRLGLVKFTAGGSMSWAKNYGGSLHETDCAVQETGNADLLICGRTMSYGAGDWDAILVRTDSNGDIPDCPLITVESPTILVPSVTVTSDAMPCSSFSITATSHSLSTTIFSPLTTTLCYSEFSPTPTPTDTPTDTPTPTVTSTSTMTPTATPTESPLPSDTPTPTATITPTPSMTPTPRPLPVSGPGSILLLLAVLGVLLSMSVIRHRF